MENALDLSASLEDYLEAILHIEDSKPAVRAKDIADRMQVKRPSVTGALNQLARRELVNYSPYEVVTLTDKGREAALDVTRRHAALKAFLMDVLGTEEELAESCACRMEHAMPRPVLERLAGFVDYLAECPAVDGEKIIREFRHYHAQRSAKGRKKE
ncbi:metal-dependent transcriptional regulator [bacterium]|nr:metal-dependent transcriptional regulator [bacterium]